MLLDFQVQCWEGSDEHCHAFMASHIIDMFFSQSASGPEQQHIKDKGENILLMAFVLLSLEADQS